MKKATFRYALINISYFMVYVGIHAYSSVFLLAKGFTNTRIGILLAIANVVSVIVQPVIAGLIDKPGPLTNRNVSIVSASLMIAGSAVLLFVKSGFLVIFITFAFIYMIQMAYQPLIIAMNFEYSKKGAKINFGLARGLGSFGFAVTSLFMGRVIAARGVDCIQIIDICILAVSVILLLTFVYKGGEEKETKEVSLQGKAHNNVWDFAKTYPRFMIFIFGAICLFFGHNALNDYIIQIITPLGGNESTMGIAIFIAAALELPTMACIGFLLKKTSSSSLLVFSGISFLVKTVLMLVAVNMAGVYLSQAMQFFAYAVFIPAAAYYVDEVMEDLDKVKGQAYINVAITLGGVFSNLLCGKILDDKGVHSMLILASAVSLAGLVIVFFGVKGKKKTV